MVERDWLAERLEAGASIEPIAREVGATPPPCRTGSVSTASRPHMPCATPRAGPSRATFHGDRGVRPVDARHGRRLGTKPDHGPALASPLRPDVRAGATARHRRGEPSVTACASWSCPANATARPGMSDAKTASGARGVKSRQVAARRRHQADRSSSEAGGGCLLCGFAECVRPCSSITSTPPRSRSRSAVKASRARLPEPGKKPRSACSCARTATPRSRAGSLNFP